jgi:hypothetical protein
MSIYYFYSFFDKRSLYSFAKLAPNVPAVYDVFLCVIKELRSNSSAQKNVGGVWRGNGAKRNDLATRNPEPL